MPDSSPESPEKQPSTLDAFTTKAYFKMHWFYEGEDQIKQMDSFFSEVDDEAIKKEKGKARLLRKSQWWKRRKSTGICHYCGEQFKPAELTMDHLVPMSRGGKNNKGNVVPACKPCNTKKKYLLPFEMEGDLESQDEGDKT